MVTPLNPYRPDTPQDDFIHGIKGKFSYQVVGGTLLDFPIESVSFDWDLEDDDITYSSANGARCRLDGIEEVTGTVTFVFNSLKVPTVAPQCFRPRTYATLTVMPDGVTPYSFVALMGRFSTSTGPKAGTVRVTSNYKSTGPITGPTASQTTATPYPGGYPVAPAA